MTERTLSPYQEAFQWIKRNPGTGSAQSLAKLLLSLWNDDFAFSYRECVDGLDEYRTAIAIRVVSHYARLGEDEELRHVGEDLYDSYPRLVALAQALTQERKRLTDQWRSEDAAAEASEVQGAK